MTHITAEDPNVFTTEIYKSLVDVSLVLLSEEKDLTKLLNRILDYSMDLSSADAGSLYVMRDGMLHFSSWRNLTFEREHRIPLLDRHQLKIDNNTICGFVASTGNGLILDDVQNLPSSLPYHFNAGFDRQYGYHTKSMVSLPLTITTGQVVGVLQLINHTKDGKVSPFP